MQDSRELPRRRPTEPGSRRVLPLLLRGLFPLAVLAGGWFGFSKLSVESVRPKSPGGKAKTIKTRVVELRARDFATTVRTRGVVRPHNEVPLTSQVAGKIVRILPGFEDGAFFSEKELLVELDPQDFETALIVAKGQLARAKSTHAQERTRAEQARLNWLDLKMDEEPNELVLRLPQLREAEAGVASAEAQLEQAKRNLERTKVRAPFAGRVRQRTIGLGQSVGVGTPLGTVFSIDYAEVRLPIPAPDRAFLSLPEDADNPPVDVELRDALGEDSTVWKGTILRTEGALDQNSLDLFAIARVIDPFGRETGRPPLRIGQPVVASIPGRVLKDVFVLPRRAVSQLDRIFLIDPVELTVESMTVEAIWSDEDHLVVADPSIADGTLLAMTNLIYAPSGSKVEILPDLDSGEAAPDDASASRTSPSGGNDMKKEKSSS